MPLLLGPGITEQAQSVTQCDRRYHQSDFVHQSKPEKTLAQHRPSHDPDVSVSRREDLVDQLLEITGIELNALPRGRQLSACDHDGRSIAIGPAQLERVLVGAGTEHKAVDGRDDLFSPVVRNPFFVDVSGAIQPRYSVVLPGDDAIKTCNHVKSYRRSSCVH